MEIAFCKYKSSIEILPSITYNKIECKGRKAYCIMIGWLKWGFDIQWEN